MKTILIVSISDKQVNDIFSITSCLSGRDRRFCTQPSLLYNPTSQQDAVRNLPSSLEPTGIYQKITKAKKVR